MYVKHLGADMVLHRARKVIGVLESAEQEYLASGSVLVDPYESAAGTPAIRLRVVRPLPAEVEALTGEVVRACRDALDDLALSLVVAGRRAPRSTTFPIAPDPHSYLEVERHCLRHANQLARRAVRSVTPWRGGDDVLWDLHQLASSGRPVIGLGQVVELAPTRVPSVLGVLQPGLHSSRACLPVSDGSLLSHPETGIQLSLTYGEPTRIRPLLPTLSMFTAHVADVIDRVVSAAESSTTPSDR